MIPEGLDKSISTVIALGSAGLALWAHRREVQRLAEESKQKYADRELKAYAAQRDFGHIQRDLDQLKNNTAHLSQEYDDRLDKLEMTCERLSGSVDALTEILKERNLRAAA
jgi:peptidoglycan hydrolase CwlO-like protein